jgi:sarcosine oxidase delta subunit
MPFTMECPYCKEMLNLTEKTYGGCFPARAAASP